MWMTPRVELLLRPQHRSLPSYGKKASGEGRDASAGLRGDALSPRITIKRLRERSGRQSDTMDGEIRHNAPAWRGRRTRRHDDGTADDRPPHPVSDREGSQGLTDSLVR